ncbi:glycosyltransferase family 4 protein [Gammaproteobacteria bacterium]|nr:glycosyltransferase family 4 protein [Gammaproteobacteria bacterium]
MRNIKDKKIILLTQFCEPEPQHVGIAFGEKLFDAGFEVEVVTGFPNYPGGKLYPGYKRRLIDSNKLNNIKLTRLWLFFSHSHSKIGRVINYLSFAFSSFIYLLFIAKKNHIIYVYHPPITVGLSACFIKLFKKSKIIIDIQDFWPDTLEATRFITNKYLLNLVSFFCNIVYKRSDHLTVLSNGFKDKLINLGIEKEKISVILNWADDEDSYIRYENTRDMTFLDPNFFNILHAGNLGPAQSLKSLIDASKIITDKGITDIKFIFLGDGMSKNSLIKYAETINADVLFIPRVDSSTARIYMEEANVMCVHLDNTPLFEITIPSKIQAYLSSGKPILAAVNGEAGNLVVTAGAGLKANANDPNSIAEAACIFYKMRESELAEMGEKGKEFYLNNLSLDQAIVKTAKLIDSLGS